MGESRGARSDTELSLVLLGQLSVLGTVLPALALSKPRPQQVHSSPSPCLCRPRAHSGCLAGCRGSPGVSPADTHPVRGLVKFWGAGDSPSLLPAPPSRGGPQLHCTREACGWGKLTRRGNLGTARCPHPRDLLAGSAPPTARPVGRQRSV